MKKEIKRRKIVLKVNRISWNGHRMDCDYCLQCYLREFYSNFIEGEIDLCDIFQGIFHPHCHIRDLKIIGYEEDI